MYPAACPRCQSPRRLLAIKSMDMETWCWGDPRFLAGHTDISLEEYRLAAAFVERRSCTHRPPLLLSSEGARLDAGAGIPAGGSIPPMPAGVRLARTWPGFGSSPTPQPPYLDQVWEAEHAHGAAGADGCRRNSLLAAGVQR